MLGRSSSDSDCERNIISGWIQLIRMVSMAVVSGEEFA